MKPLALFLLASAAWSQPLRSDPNRISILPTLRSDPPSSPLLHKFTPTVRDRSFFNGPGFYTRILIDPRSHAYLGYELLIEKRLAGTYLATFGKLGVTPMDLAASLSEKLPIDLQWTNVALPSLPEPRTIKEGDTFSIELYDDPSGDKLIDDIRLNPIQPVRRFVPLERAPPTVSGPVRDFSPTDAEMQLVQPRALFLNETSQGPPTLRNVRGPLVWIYLPGHGRYILSLSPRRGLNFTQTGEVRGGVLSFTIDQDAIKLECPTPIAVGDAAYNLWVLHDKTWEPISEAQKDRPGIGSVGAAELTLLSTHP